MVLKRSGKGSCGKERFESSVILDGTQTWKLLSGRKWQFESSVILDGAQTVYVAVREHNEFESSVILDGTQTKWTDKRLAAMVWE